MTEVLPPSDWITVQSPQAAKLLSSIEMRQVLGPFMGKSRTLKGVAEELGVDLNWLLLRVRKLLKAGLLNVVQETPRAGRAIKHYQSVALGFFVPYTLTRFETPEGWMLEDYQSREQELARCTMQLGSRWGQTQGHSTFGKRFFLRQDGLLEADFAFGMTEPADLLEEDAPAILSAFIYTDLDPESAKDLQRELAELVARYERKGTGKRHLLRLGLSPVE